MASIRYKFDTDVVLTIKGGVKANAQKIGEALEAIRQGHKGELRPSDVVEAAKADDHALHALFEWDDAKAAHAHRLDQARGIIRVIRTDDPELEGQSVRAFYSLNAKSGTSYRSVGDVLGSRDLQARVMLNAERELEAFTRRYRELRHVCAKVTEALEVLRTPPDETHPH